LTRLAALPLIYFAIGGVPDRGPVRPPPTAQGSVQLTLEIPATVRTGEPVPITLRLVNASDSAVEVVLHGRPAAFDVVVSGPTHVVWRRLEGAVIASILQLRLVEPGDTLRFETTWDQRTHAGRPVAPGEYTVTAEIPTDPPAVFRAAPARLRILP
jgi:hypothetical protein